MSGSDYFQARVIIIPNPLMDVRLLSYARSIPRDYMDENEVLHLLLSGVCAQILEDPDGEFPFSVYEHYDAMLRDMLSPILIRTVDDPDAALDTTVDESVDSFTTMHNSVYDRIVRSYPNVSHEVTLKTHTFTITTVRGASLWELEGEDDDLQIVFLRTPTLNLGTRYARPDHYHPQRAG